MQGGGVTDSNGSTSCIFPMPIFTLLLYNDVAFSHVYIRFWYQGNFSMVPYNQEARRYNTAWSWLCTEKYHLHHRLTWFWSFLNIFCLSGLCLWYNIEATDVELLEVSSWDLSSMGVSASSELIPNFTGHSLYSTMEMPKNALFQIYKNL